MVVVFCFSEVYHVGGLPRLSYKIFITAFFRFLDSNIIGSISSTFSTNSNDNFSLAFAGTSTRSFSFLFGRIMVVIPALFAASTFSLIPPTGKTLPLSVISPVIAI